MTTTEDFVQCVVCQGIVNHVCRCSCGHADPDADERLNERFGNSEQLQGDAGSDGDARDIEDPYDVITRAAQKLLAAGQPRIADRLVRARAEVERLQAAALAARQPAQGGTLIGWRMIDGVRVFEVASHSGIVEPQQFVRYDDYLAASQPVKQEPAFFANRWEMEHGTADGLVAMRAGKHVKIKDFFTVPLYTAPPAPAAVPVDGEAGVIEALLQLAFAAWSLADDAEDNGDTLTVDRAGFDELSRCLDTLDELPDSQPGYVMEAAAKARWALRRLLATHPQPAAAKDLAAMRPRIEAAIRRITSGHGCMRIPAEETDPDLVLADVLQIIDQQAKPEVGNG